MTHTAKLARHDALTEAIRATDEAIGDEPPTDQALRIIKILKQLRDDCSARVGGTERRDYMSEVQKIARDKWLAEYDGMIGVSQHHDATASIGTPIGRLSATVWQQQWSGARGTRMVWGGSYTLDGEPITIEEIKAAGLARRPTTRNRQRKA